MEAQKGKLGNVVDERPRTFMISPFLGGQSLVRDGPGLEDIRDQAQETTCAQQH